MKKLYSSGALQLIPAAKGFVFMAKQNEVEDKFVVAYKLYDLETFRESLVTRSVYLLAKFGPNFKFFEKELEDYINCVTVLLPDHGVFIAYPGGKCLRYDSECRLLWQGSVTYQSYGPGATALGGDGIWLSFPECDTVVKYKLSTMRPELRVGAGRSDLFIRPGALYLEDGFLYVCSSSINKITRLKLSTFETEDYGSYIEPVKQFVKLDRRELVLTDSGIYIDL